MKRNRISRWLVLTTVFTMVTVFLLTGAWNGRAKASDGGPVVVTEYCPDEMHSYVINGISWVPNDEGYYCVVTVGCNNCSFTTEITDSDPTVISVAATCYSPSYSLGTAVFLDVDSPGILAFLAENTALYTSVEFNVGTTLPHTYGTPDWEWTDFSQATATFTCTNDGCTDQVEGHTITKEASITNNNAVPSCTGPVEKVYTATVQFNGQNYTNNKTETLNQAAHTYGEAVKENEVAATCKQPGSYDSVVYCTKCGEEQSRETVVVPQGNHIPNNPVKEIKEAPTCQKEGSFDSVIYCVVCGSEIDRKTGTVKKLDHTPGEPVKENEIVATCQKEGHYDLVAYCTECGEEYSRDTMPIAKVDHTPGEPVIEKEIPATYLETGSYDSVVYCTHCGEELSRTSVEVPTLEYTPRGKSIPLEPATTRTAEEPTRPAPAPVPVPGLQRPAAPAAPAGTPAQPAVINFEIVQIPDVDAIVDILAEDFTRAGKTLALDEDRLKAVLNSVNAPEPISVESAVQALGGNFKTYRSNGKEAPVDPDLEEYHFLCSFEQLKLQNEQSVDRYGNPQPFEVTAYYTALADLQIEDIGNTMMMVYNPESGDIALIQLEAANLNNSNELKVTIPFPGLFTFIQK